MGQPAAASARIAILIIGHANPRTFRRLVAALRHPDIAVFVHLDARSDPAAFHAPGQDHVAFIPDRIANHWGAFTQVEVALRLMRSAQAAGPFASYALVSADSMPLVTSEVLIAALSATPTALRLREQLPADKSYQRVRDVYVPSTLLGRIRGHASHLDRHLTAEDLDEMQRAMRMADRKRNLPFRVYKGSQWIAVSDAHLCAVLEMIARDPGFVDIFRYSLIPDEMFFHTALKLVDPGYESPGGIMEVDWTRKPKPFTFRDVREADMIFRSNSLFFRKFCDEGLALVDAVLDRRLDLAAVHRLGTGVPWRFLRGQAAAARLAPAEPRRAEED